MGSRDKKKITMIIERQGQVIKGASIHIHSLLSLSRSLVRRGGEQGDGVVRNPKRSLLRSVHAPQLHKYEIAAW